MSRNPIKKPSVNSGYLTLPWAQRISEAVEIIMGRRTGRRVSAPIVTATKITAAPSAADYNKLVDDLLAMRARFEELLDQVQDA